MNVKFGTLATIMILLTTCSCAPVYPNLTTKQFQFEEVGDSKTAQVYIYRMLTPPTLRSPDISINGRKRLVLKAGSFGKVTVTPGATLVETKWSWDTGVENKFTYLTVEPRRSYFVRCNTEMFGLFFVATLQEVPKEMAIFEMNGLKNVSNTHY